MSVLGFFEAIKRNDGIARATLRDLVERDSLVPGYFMPRAVFDETFLAAISTPLGEDKEWARLCGFRIVAREGARFAIVSVEYHYSALRQTIHHLYKVEGAEVVNYVRGRLDEDLRQRSEEIRAREAGSDTRFVLEAVSA